MANNDLGWNFPSTGGGDDDGLNDPLITYFAGDYERFIAREAIQNSLDAKYNDDVPVRVVFERFELPTDQIPGIPTLRDILDKAREYGKDQDNTAAFYSSATELASKPAISVLRVGDYNTTGLCGGDHDKDKSWHRLLRTQGENAMRGDGGGSFGIGKGAPFSASGVRTVFYSTLNQDGESAFQGKARISSFVDESGDTRRGIGSYGILLEKGVASIRQKDAIPPFFLREEQGTDLFIIGYKACEGDWRKNLTESILNNFWAAIHFGSLEVELKDDQSCYSITSETLKGSIEQFNPDGLPFYMAVTEKEHFFEGELRNIGKVTLYLKIGQDYPRTVQMMRSPKMLVYPKAGNRGLVERYAGVFICDDPEGNKKLRNLEPPKHDTWDSKLQTYGQKLMLELNNWIKERLREATMYKAGDAEEIPDLNKYLPETSERDDLNEGHAQRGELTGSETEVESAREIERTAESAKEVSMNTRQEMKAVSNAAGHGTDNTRLGTVSRTNETHGDGTSDTETGNLPRIETSSLTFRSFAKQAGKEGYEYVLILNPVEDARGAMRILGVGDGVDYPLDIESAQEDGGKALKVAGSAIENIALAAGQQKKIRLRLKDKRRYVLSLEAYAK